MQKPLTERNNNQEHECNQKKKTKVKMKEEKKKETLEEEGAKTIPMQIPLMAPLVQEEVSSTCESAEADRIETLLAFTPLDDSLDCRSTDIHTLRQGHSQIYTVSNTHAHTHAHTHASTHSYAPMHTLSLSDTTAVMQKHQHRQKRSKTCLQKVYSKSKALRMQQAKRAKHNKACHYTPSDTIISNTNDRQAHFESKACAAWQNLPPSFHWQPLCASLWPQLSPQLRNHRSTEL